VGSSLERTKYPGYQDLNQETFQGHSNYNALQVSVQHRLSSGFLLGMAYSWSKALGVTSYDALMGPGALYQNNDARNYGPLASDRRQSLVINYSYQFPSPGKSRGNKLLGAVADDWTFSGLTSFITGAPFSPTFTTGGADITGSGNETARLNVVGNPMVNVPSGSIFNPAAFTAPLANSGDVGNLGVNALSQPGYQDWDMAITKFIPVGLEKGSGFSVQLQAFNVFNHAQFSTFANNVSNSNFGQATADTGARVMALNLRFTF